ncbi:uncharacterized protein LOC134215238 [Armigeres subalbatus]|uniref:uncharacterized protein LOC134215238 n=1 Tax=Armigeres subalbatus TaxID=124917 RepID=UPI002ED10EAA
MCRAPPMESLTEVIIALIKNSLDANCTSIAIRICLELFWIQILDNGDGISREDLQSIGKFCQVNIDFQRKKPSKQFARLTGESLLDIIPQCEEVLIESVDGKANDHKSHSRLFKQRTATSSQRSFDSVSRYHHARKSRGTTVTLKNVFYRDPERQRHHSIRKDYRTLLVEIRALALVHFDRSFTVQDLSNGEVVFKSKRLTAFLPKYCELYDLSETEIDVITCTKDNVLIECYFSERRLSHPSSPIELTFINGLPSSELLPITSNILTQQKHDIDFVIVVTYPRNDVLTQLNEPIVKNCLSRCLNLFTDCLRRREEQQQLVSLSTGGNAAKTQNDHQTMVDNYFGEVTFQQHHDEEDVIYGLSQPKDDQQTTFDKCSKWLKTNQFDIPKEPSPVTTAQKLTSRKPTTGNKERQKVNFFDITVPAAKSDNRKTNSNPQNKPSMRLPMPKFYPSNLKTNSKAEKVGTINKQPPRSEHEFVVTERPPERMSFLNIASELNVSKITMPEEIIPVQAKILQFAKKEKKKLGRSPPKVISPQPSDSPEWKKSEPTFFAEFDKSNNFVNATSFSNDSPVPTEKKDCFLLTPQVVNIVKAKPEPVSTQSFENFPLSYQDDNDNTVSSGISYAFVEPLFLEPIQDPDDTLDIGSPRARFFDLDMVQSYREFHQACRETIQHFKVAIEPIERTDYSSDEEGCACCSSHQFNREIEILRQPFHKPRNILTKVGSRHQMGFYR